MPYNPELGFGPGIMDGMTGEPGEVPRDQLPEIVSFTAAEPIHPGRAVEIAADGLSIQQVQQTGAICWPVGIAIRHRRRGAGYNIGDTVPVLMRGRIFARWLGALQPTVGGSLNLYHSSTDFTNRGTYTDAPVSTAVGAEVAAAGPKVSVSRQGMGMGDVVLVDVAY